MNTEDFQRTILSQYSNSHSIVDLLERFNYRVDPEIDIDEYWVQVHNLDTCGTFGLDVWGIIVGAPRTIEVDAQDYFGFHGTNWQPFNTARFYTGKLATNVFTLSNDAYRKLIYFKAAINIMQTTMPEIDRILISYFNSTRPQESQWDLYSQETGVMKMRVVFRFRLTPIERAIFRTYGVTKMRPGGVMLEFVEIPYETFGFLGSRLQPFNVGTFYSGTQR